MDAFIARTCAHRSHGHSPRADMDALDTRTHWTHCPSVKTQRHRRQTSVLSELLPTKHAGDNNPLAPQMPRLADNSPVSQKLASTAGLGPCPSKPALRWAQCSSARTPTAEWLEVDAVAVPSSVKDGTFAHLSLTALQVPLPDLHTGKDQRSLRPLQPLHAHAPILYACILFDDSGSWFTGPTPPPPPRYPSSPPSPTPSPQNLHPQTLNFRIKL